MENLLLFVLLGLGSGALISGVALALVITYRGSGVINLATGAIAMLSGYAFWALGTSEFGVSLPIPVAVLAALTCAAGAGVLVDVFVFRPLRSASPLARLAASLGVLLSLQAAVLIGFGDAAKPEPTILPSATVALAGTVVPVNRFILAGIILTITAVLAGVYRWSRFGLATRAAAENETAAVIAGLSPGRLSFANTLVASLVAGLVGILAASVVQLDGSTLPLQVVPALAAALFARFTSLWIASLAGLGIGVAQSLVYYASTQSWFPLDNGVPLPGVQQLLVFVLVLVAMYWRGAAIPDRGELTEKRLPKVPVPLHLLRTSAIITGVAVVALVVFPFDFRQALTNSIIGAVIIMSYVVVTGYVGQISVVQLALSGVAGFSVSHLAVDAHLGFPVGPILAVGIAVLLGMIAAVGSLRARGVTLAAVTLAAAVAMEQFIFANSTWGAGDGSPVPSPTIFGVIIGPDAAFRGLDGKQPSPAFGFVALIAAVAIGTYVANLRRTTMGRRMIAVRDNERAAAAAGVNVRLVKLGAYAVSSFIAGVAGVLYAYNFGSVSASRFGALTALSLIAFAYLGGVTRVSGAVVAGLFSTEALFPHALEEWLGLSGAWALLFGGIALVLTLIGNPDGVAGAPPPWRALTRQKIASNSGFGSTSEQETIPPVAVEVRS